MWLRMVQMRNVYDAVIEKGEIEHLIDLGMDSS